MAGSSDAGCIGILKRLWLWKSLEQMTGTGFAVSRKPDTPVGFLSAERKAVLMMQLFGLPSLVFMSPTTALTAIGSPTGQTLPPSLATTVVPDITRLTK